MCKSTWPSHTKRIEGILATIEGNTKQKRATQNNRRQNYCFKFAIQPYYVHKTRFLQSQKIYKNN